MKLNEIFSGNYLKAEDLPLGRLVRVTISRVEVKEFDDKERKIVLSFQGKEKCLVVNKTNASIIAENTKCQDTDGWVGQTIQLTVKKVEFQGKLVPAIRVVLEEQPVARPPAVAPVAPPVAAPAEDFTSPPGDDVPF